MDRGRWDSTVDAKWRVIVPAVVMKKIKNRVLLGQGKEGYIQIYTQFSAEKKNPVFPAELKTNCLGLRRITIPQNLRKSTSFYYGKRITIAGKNNHWELWPRP